VTIDESGSNRIVVVPGANLEYGVEDVKQIHHIIRAADVVLLQLEIPLETVSHAVEMASRYKVPVTLNPAPAQPLSEETLRNVSCLTPNETEAEMLSGVKITDLNTARATVSRLLEMGVTRVVITLGEDGALYVDQSGTGHVPAFAVDVVDTVAAGDAFNAGLVVALTLHKPLRETVQFANTVGALTVTRHGAIPSLPSLNEVTDLLGT
jgi:ribokinase